MVLVDTSVWLRSFGNREPFKTALDNLLELDQVVGHELVYGELFIGDVGGRRHFLAEYGRFRQARLVPHREVVDFVRFRRLHERGIRWIHAHLLASAVVERLQLWTADERFAAVAAECGVAYKPARF